MEHKAIVVRQKKWDYGRFWLTGLVKFIPIFWRPPAFKQTEKGTIIWSFIHFQDCLKNAQYPQRCHIFCAAVIRGRNSGKSGFGHQRRESEADKSRRVTQESSLIICAFLPWSSEVERSELPFYYEMTSQKSQLIPRAASKHQAKNVQREFSGVVPVPPRHLGV